LWNPDAFPLAWSLHRPRFRGYPLCTRSCVGYHCNSKCCSTPDGRQWGM